MTAIEQWADWHDACMEGAICGTRMIEHSRESIGLRWCFRHRKREEFFWAVMVPDGLSYYGPDAHMEGPSQDCTDLFPGWVRQALDE